MKDLLDKLSSYNLFNYLLPGILLALAIDRFALIRVVQKDIAIGIFLYYFLGSIVSRVGSLIVEPFLLKIKFQFIDTHYFIWIIITGNVGFK